MTDLTTLLKGIRRRPAMYLGHSDITFKEVVAYLLGHDAACGRLYGFHEFLVLRLGTGHSVFWPALVRSLALGTGNRPESPEDQEKALTTVFDLVTEFLAEVNAGGLDRILHEHGTWLRQQSWYEPDLQRMHSSPPHDVETADEAASALGLTRRALFEDLHTLGMTPLRRGAEVVFRRRDVAAVAARRTEGGGGP